MENDKCWIVFTHDVLACGATDDIVYYRSEPFPGWSGRIESASLYTEYDAKKLASLVGRGNGDIKIDIHPRFRYA
jgi:hypothetical protein